MPSSLVTLWRDNTAFFSDKSCAQVVGLAGDGRLRDASDASTEFRELLELLPSEQLRSYAEECLTQKFEDAAFALQDTVNEIGTRLGFTVEPGRYRGARNQVGFDGIWRSSDGYALLIEVKTTDAYRINLGTIANYRGELLTAQRIQEPTSSILIAVGRQDTGDLEAQIRGSRHAWDIRVISIDALLRLITIKEQMSDWTASSRINMLLRPLEYTRVDGIIDVLFDTTADIETSQDETQDHEGAEHQHLPSTETAATFHHDSARKLALSKLEAHLGTTLKKKGRVLWSAVGQRCNVVCLSSQPYEERGLDATFWYGFTPGHKAFLEDAHDGYALFACGTELSPVAIPTSDFLPMLNTTAPHGHGLSRRHDGNSSILMPLAMRVASVLFR